MEQDLKYKFLSETQSIFEQNGWRGIEGLVFSDDIIKIYWYDKEKSTWIANKDAVPIFKKYNEQFAGDELKKKIYDTAIEMLKKQREECEEFAREKAKQNKKIFKIRCIYEDSKTLVHGRSQYDYKMSELYGMCDETMFEECKKQVNRFRREDNSYWHVLDENDNIIY